jgi:hypothetical protein
MFNQLSKEWQTMLLRYYREEGNIPTGLLTKIHDLIRIHKGLNDEYAQLRSSQILAVVVQQWEQV